MPTDKPTPPRPISSHTVPWTERNEVPRFARRYRHLTRAAVGDTYRVGVAIEELAPGKQSAPAHYHLLEEEHVLILEGRATLRLGAETHAMTAGDYVCFPAGQKAGHCLVNDGPAPCRYVIVGEQIPSEVVVYPDANKMLVRALGRQARFDLAATRGYWDGEDTGLPPGTPLPSPASLDSLHAETRPKPPIASATVEPEETEESTNFGGRAQHLTYAAVGADYRVGLLLEAPAPGRRLAPLHYHMEEEEHALVLEGEVTLLLGEERHVMTAGDYVCFPAGLKVGHSFLNSGAGPCRYLMIGQRNAADVCVCPHSNKMIVSGLRTRSAVFDMGAMRGYWDGEEVG